MKALWSHFVEKSGRSLEPALRVASKTVLTSLRRQPQARVPTRVEPRASLLEQPSSLGHFIRAGRGFFVAPK
ncbi:MAG TPA: hypothetical protein VH186_32985 [Chloroflexia bacterium]|nr:hypothetical protein [Chloroflexia bacterium]